MLRDFLIFLPGAFCLSGAVPLSRLAVVSEGQEGQGGRLLVCPGHHTAIQQVGQCRLSILSLADEAAHPTESTTAGEMDQCCRGQRTKTLTSDLQTTTAHWEHCR